MEPRSRHSARRPDQIVVSQGPNYAVLEGQYPSGARQRAIQCLRCQMVSYNVNDIENRYCGSCHCFHEAATWASYDSEISMDEPVHQERSEREQRDRQGLDNLKIALAFVGCGVVSWAPFVMGYRSWAGALFAHMIGVLVVGVVIRATRVKVG